MDYIQVYDTFLWHVRFVLAYEWSPFFYFIVGNTRIKKRFNVLNN
jgi:hypothetical protein